MNAPKCTEYDYINFLVAAQQVFSTVEASRSHPDGEEKPAHDAYTRLLQRLPPDSEALWTEVRACIELNQGLLMIDDTTLDKPYASAMALVSRHWSGKHHDVVQGINLMSLAWSDGDACLPCDYRVYHKEQDGLSKNDHFRAMLQQAHTRGFRPSLVAFDSWYSSLENLKLVRGLGWEWLTRLKRNRQVSLSAGQQQAVSALDIPSSGLTVHLRGYGLVKVFRTVDPHGNAEHWATSRLDMTDAQRQLLADRAWLVEVYAPSSSSPALSAGSFASSVRSATTSVWRCVRMCAWNFIAGALVSRSLTASSTSFALQFDIIWRIPPIA